MKKEKILLIMLPFWTPLVPPQGISYLKHFLQHHGYTVKAKDGNTDEKFKELYNKYFDILKEYVPPDKQGNFYNIGHDVLRNHMIAHVNKVDEKQYIELVRTIIYKTYFTSFSDFQVSLLNEVLDEFYRRLKEYLLILLKKESPDVFGVSVLRDTIGPSLFAFKLCKEKYPHILTVMGGCVFSDHLRMNTPNFKNFVEKTPYIDKIVVGEGQLLFLNLLEERFPPRKKVVTLEDIDGKTLGYSSLNVPDMTDFNVGQDYPYLSAQASSSCPNQCSFCNVASFYGKYREKDPDQTVDEMIRLFETYRLQVFFMNDALLNRVATPLARGLIKADKALYWDGYLRVDGAVEDHDVTLLWRRGGMYRARLGVESGSQHVLDLIKKEITLDQTKKALISLANAGIKTTTYWVVGHPGESETDFQETLNLLTELKEYIYEAECNPFIYGYSGQGKSEEWQDSRILLYPEEAADMLIIQTWIVDGEPSREETYRRIARFVEHCKKMGIPNPYSLHEIHNADKRWERLHKNAVPPLAHFKKNDAYINECRDVKKIIYLHSSLQNDGDFGF